MRVVEIPWNVLAANILNLFVHKWLPFIIMKETIGTSKRDETAAPAALSNFTRQNYCK